MVVAFPCWHERGSEARPGEGIGEIQPRSDVLGLEDEATWQGVYAVYFARSLRRKPLKHIAEWAGDFADAREGIINSHKRASLV